MAVSSFLGQYGKMEPSSTTFLRCLLCILQFRSKKSINVAIGIGENLKIHYMSGDSKYFPSIKRNHFQKLLWLRSYGALPFDLANSAWWDPTPHALPPHRRKALLLVRQGNPIFNRNLLGQSNIGNGWPLFQVTMGIL